MGRTSLKRKLQVLRDHAKKHGSDKQTRFWAMEIYRQRPEYITKEDLLLFGILIKKS